MSRAASRAMAWRIMSPRTDRLGIRKSALRIAAAAARPAGRPRLRAPPAGGRRGNTRTQVGDAEALGGLTLGDAVVLVPVLDHEPRGLACDGLAHHVAAD